MPCYNASAYVKEAIESVQHQSYTDWELLVIDDGSADDSRSIIKTYAEQDNRIRLIEQPNSGACRARNNGIEHAKGEFLKFLDADDILEPDCLQEQVAQIATLVARQIPFGNYCNVDKDGNILSKYVFGQSEKLAADQVYFFFSEWRILISAPLHRTSLLREIGGFDESLKRGQESDMHFRLALADVEFVYRPCETFRYRDHSTTTRISNRYKEGTKERYIYRIQYAHTCERLLTEKYGKMPMKYWPYFSSVWFNFARELFAQKKKEEGLLYLNKSKQYGIFSTFNKVYITAGAVVGYVLLERIFQLRLKIIGKK